MSARTLPPHLQIAGELVDLFEIGISNEGQEPLASSSDWRAPDSVSVSAELELASVRKLKSSCGLSGEDDLVAVMQAAGTSVRSRVTVATAPIKKGGSLRLAGTVPVGFTDVQLIISISIQLANHSSAAPPAPRRPGAVVWEHSEKLTLGTFQPELKILREDFSHRRGEELIPWFVDLLDPNLDRPFTEAVVIRVNSAHTLGQHIETGARGLRGTIEKAIRIQMYNDIERQLLAIALSMDEVRERPYVENAESLGDVLRHRIAVSMPNREPDSAYQQFIKRPVDFERKMVRQRYDR